jgi:hypothetical protein
MRIYQSRDFHWCKTKSQVPLYRPFQIGETRRQQLISVREHLESERFAQIGVSAIKKLDLVSEKFKVPRDVIYSYVEAVILTETHTLQVCQGDELILTFDCEIPDQEISG